MTLSRARLDSPVNLDSNLLCVQRIQTASSVVAFILLAHSLNCKW